MNRRRFLQQSAAATFAAALTPLTHPAASGANGDIRLAIVGFNGHGTGAHLKSYLKMPGVRIVALCDPDRRVLAKGLDLVRAANPSVRATTDIRELLDQPDIDAISGATPNHWHALSTVWACQAGKHVCVEKPVSHNIWEGRKMVEAAAKYDRLVQADLDLRSSPARDEAIAYLQGGTLGKVQIIHSWVYKRRRSIGRVEPAGIVPEAVDYDLWCGPSPLGPLPRKNLHYDWHWQWDTGNGEVGNNGPHQLDVCRWALGENGLPRNVISFGGRYGYRDDGETPNTQIVLYEYPSAPVLFEVRGLPESSASDKMDDFHAHSRTGLALHRPHPNANPHNAVLAVCENGYVDLTGLKAYDRQGKEIRAFTAGTARTSTENFIRALRSGKKSDLRTTIENGHLSTAVCHLGNISYRIGQNTSLEQSRDAIGTDPQVLDSLDRVEEHLAANGIRLSQEGLTCGPRLTVDSDRERFVGPFAQPANALLKREYRAPFVIPEQV